MQLEAESVLEYIVDNTVGVDATASRLAARYRLSGKLGEGAFSQVWRGQRLGGGEPCALKCIGLESLDDDDEALEMLANEVAALRAAAQGLGAAQRRHVLGLREVVRTSEEVCLVVDLVAGSELFELIERHGALPEPMVRHLVRQLLGALAALHGLGICHRDIKCENAMVTGLHSAASATLVLIDFGYAAVTKASPPTLTGDHAEGSVGGEGVGVGGHAP